MVNWDFDSGDSVGKSASQSIAAYKKIKTGSPVIALNHEASCGRPIRRSASGVTDCSLLRRPTSPP